jgi:hypothetical protein
MLRLPNILPSDKLVFANIRPFSQVKHRTPEFMSASEKDILQYANDSGFPLQIALQHAVESAKDIAWRVRYVEHEWVHPDKLGNGFIDLVLHDSNRRQCLVIAVRGQGKSDRETMLEKIGSELALSTEALAHAERDFRPASIPYIRTFTPILVTTASLSVVDFDPSTISLQNGKVPAAEVKKVPWLRFRKQLATRCVQLSANDYSAESDPSYLVENTIFIVQASSLIDFLRDFKLQVP